MLKILKVPVEPLTPLDFAPFGQVISTFDEAKPEVVVGELVEHEVHRTGRGQRPHI